MQPQREFEEWVNFCVAQGYSGGSDPDPLEADPAALASYLIRLFESPAWLAERYSDFELGKLTWYLFGSASGYLGIVRCAPLERELHVRCIAAVATMYTDLFDKVCGRRGAEPDADLLNTSEIDGAVYMIWDMDCLEGTILFPAQHPHLVDPAIGVLRTVLERCRTSACLISALHGAGHIIGFHSRSGNDAIVARMRGMIDTFLRRRASDWVREYAVWAREGRVQ